MRTAGLWYVVTSSILVQLMIRVEINVALYVLYTFTRAFFLQLKPPFTILNLVRGVCPHITSPKVEVRTLG
jgi:hypothetical protein